LSFGRVAFAANPVVFFVDHVVLVSLFLEIHGGADARRSAANDADALIQISHVLTPFWLSKALQRFYRISLRFRNNYRYKGKIPIFVLPIGLGRAV
jgi:hypothetical protein